MANASASVLLPNPIPKITFTKFETKNLALNQKVLKICKNSKLNATGNGIGFAEIEPDLNEDPVDRWATPGIDPEDFIYGEYDGHHTFFEGEDTGPGAFLETLKEEYESVDPPSGFQGFIAWIFLPAMAAGMYFDVPKEYLFIGAGLFTAIYGIIEMDKPDKPHHFEPQIYMMERRARDKLIHDHNTMSIWDFNDKYEDVWDFTVKVDPEDILKR